MIVQPESIKVKLTSKLKKNESNTILKPTEKIVIAVINSARWYVQGVPKTTRTVKLGRVGSDLSDSFNSSELLKKLRTSFLAPNLLPSFFTNAVLNSCRSRLKVIFHCKLARNPLKTKLSCFILSK